MRVDQPRLGLEQPVIQAPIGRLTTPELAAAVSNAGGLGTLALTWTSAAAARRRIEHLRRLTDRPFAVNLVLCFDVDALLDVALRAEVPLISTFWGDPGRFVQRIHDAGSLHLHSVGGVGEAERAADVGVDVIVAQGCEAGGHIRGSVSTLALVPAVVDAVAPVPVVAAGGIADGRGLAAVLALGAQAGWLGTRFAAAPEAATHPRYREAIIAAGADDAWLSECFDGGWPDAPHRTLSNSTLRHWSCAGCPSAPHRPREAETVARSADGAAIPAYSSAAPLRDMAGDAEAMALYAGQSVGLISEMLPAADLVTTIATDARRLLSA